MFNSLPLDMQKKILSEDKDVLVRSLPTSKKFSQMLLQSVIDLCERPIGFAELTNYLNTSNSKKSAVYFLPNKISLSIEAYIYFNVLPNHTVKNVIDTQHAERISRGTKQYRVIYQLPFSVESMSMTKDIEHHFMNTDNIFDIDLLTYYKILKNRLGCVTANPEYAKSKTIDKLNKIVNSMNFGINKLNLYVYLISYKWIFNIDIPVIENTFYLDSDENLNVYNVNKLEYQTIEEDIPKWIDSISEAIHKLT